jgi:hypothetical protein
MAAYTKYSKSSDCLSGNVLQNYNFFMLFYALLAFLFCAIFISNANEMKWKRGEEK